MRRKRGAPAGNQNAKTHGFYSKALSDAEVEELKQAVEVDGIDAEIALVRVKLKRVLENDPQNMKLIMLAADTIGRLLTASQTMTPAKKKEVEESTTRTYENVAFPMGFNRNKIVIGINRRD